MAEHSRLQRALVRSPFFWGAALAGLFYGLAYTKVLDHDFVHQYFAGHPVEYVATTLFLVGLAGLGIKLVDVSLQRQSLRAPLLPAGEPLGSAAETGQALLARLERLPRDRQDEYLVRRIREALRSVARTGHSHGLADELRYLADLDAHRVHASYGLVRMIIWAIPILGFLGTVIGIALAIGKLSPQALEDSLPEVMAGLTVAFNTTAMALGLSMVLMFALFLTERQENALLAQVDERAESELAGRFASVESGPTPALADVRAMAQAVIEATEELVRRQSQLWANTIRAAETRWASLTAQAGSQLERALTAALEKGLQEHASQMAAQEQLFTEKNRQQWSQLQQATADQTRVLAELHAAVAEEAKLLGRVVGAADQVARLEETLNQNLAALAGSKNFEETVMSLAAAIHLLNSRLGQMPAVSPVQLEDRRTGHAA